MKTSRAFVLATATLVVGFLAARWCAAQSSGQPSNREPATDDYIALHQLESFVSYLQDTKQTNTLARFNNYCNVTIVSRCSADLGMRTYILYALRSGRTNEAIHLLEQQMTSDAIGFAASYRELPAPLREKVGFTSLKEARDYCSKYPVRSGHSDVDEIVASAFKVLDEKTTK